MTETFDIAGYARISVTGEIFVKVYEGRLEREQDPEIGINMLVDA